MVCVEKSLTFRLGLRTGPVLLKWTKPYGNDEEQHSPSFSQAWFMSKGSPHPWGTAGGLNIVEGVTCCSVPCPLDGMVGSGFWSHPWHLEWEHFETCPCCGMKFLLMLPRCLGDRTRNANGRNVPSHCSVLQALHQICLPLSKYPSWALKWSQPGLKFLKLLNFFCKSFLSGHHWKITLNYIVFMGLNIYIFKQHKKECYYSSQTASWLHFLAI